MTEQGNTNPRPKVMTGTSRRSLMHIPADFRGVNESGWKPLDDKVLVLPDEVLHESAGGIKITDEHHEKETMRIEWATIIAMGPAAFQMSGDRVRLWELDGMENPRPKVGDRVFIERYSGQLLDGADGKTYRLLDDKCIAAVADTGS